MKLTDERHEQLMRGKSTLDYGRAIESTVRQQYEPVLRALVEAHNKLLQDVRAVNASGSYGVLLSKNIRGSYKALTTTQRLLDDNTKPT